MEHRIGGALLIAEQAPQHIAAVIIAAALAMAVIVLIDRYERTR